MKKQLIALLGLGLLVATTSAYAQTLKVKANVPFSFIVGKVNLPAGQYTVQSLGTSGNALYIRDSNGPSKTMVNSHRCESRKTSEKSKLVFHRYGDRYFLAQIWTAGNDSGNELPKSARETEVAMDFTMHEVVLLAALQ